MLNFMRSLGFVVEATRDGPELRHVIKRLAPAASAHAL